MCAHHRAIHQGIQAHTNPVGAQLARAGGRPTLGHGKPGVPAGLVHLNVSGQLVHAGGLQPLVRPPRQILPRGLRERPQQIVERGIVESVAGEVAAHPGEERVPTHIGLELLQNRRALRIRNAIEILFDRFDVVGVGRHRVRRRQLVLIVRPRLLHIGERHPRRVILRHLRLGHHRPPRGKRLIQPQIIPPGHGDQVAEPHVGHLVQHRLAPTLIAMAGVLRSKHILVPVGDRAGVLHGPRIKLRHKQLIVFAERVGGPKILVVKIETLLGFRKQGVGIQMIRQRLAAIQPQGDHHLARLIQVFGMGSHLAPPFVGDLMVRAGTQRHQVGGQQVINAGRKHHLAGITLDGGHLLRGIRHHRPVGRGSHRQRVGGLHIRLVETGKHPLGVGGLKLGVQIHLVIHRVNKPVQALAGAGILAGGGDHQLVGTGGEIIERNAEIRPIGDVDKLTVKRDRLHRLGDQVNKRGTGGGNLKPHRGHRRERGIAAGHIHGNAVINRTNDRPTFLRFLAGQIRRRHRRKKQPFMKYSRGRRLPR